MNRAQAQGKEGRDRGPSAPPALGFNHYSTSDKPTRSPIGEKVGLSSLNSNIEDYNDGLFTVDRTESRNRRMRSAVITGARLLDEQSKANGRRSRVAFITLTYADIDGWKPNHFSAFAKHIREWCKRRKCTFRYVFKAELQQRGAVHYHVLVWLPKGITLPKPDKQGWWRHGHTSIEYARNPVAYIAKYAAKVPTGRPLPRGIRYHGVGGLTGHHLNEKRWWAMPTWARDRFAISDCPVRVQGGGIASRITGEFEESPYIVVSSGQGKIVIMRKDKCLH